LHEETIAKLVELGFARNEALAYLTLVEGTEDGLTGYEVASRSGIPRSAVYTVLRKLENAGAAFAVGDRPARYLATSPARLVEHLRRSTESKLDLLAVQLEKVPTRAQPEPIWIVGRYEEVITRIDAMVRTAERSVYLSLWDRELSLLMPALEYLADRDLHCVLHSPDRVSAEPPGFSLWIDDVGDDTEKSTWSHKALVVVDRREAVIGGTEPGADNQTVWTSNPSLVDTATNHIILDITLLAQAQGRNCVGDVGPMMRPHLPRSE
jgi:HTH-type transcriptional regulator, sugar sensing transcriptional regulator